MDANEGVIPTTGKAEPQIGAAAPKKYDQTADGSLFEVDFQLETSFNEPRNRLHHPLCSFPAANVDDKSICVPDKAQMG